MERSTGIDGENLESSPFVKVHEVLCKELQKIIDVVAHLIPVIESARPGWKSGIEELCSLSNSVEKGKLIIQHCKETSKFYSVTTRDATLSRCERVKHAIKTSLIHIQCMVPDPLATQIANVLDSLMDVKFINDVNEEEAGNALLSLLRRSDVDEDVEFEAFQIAASRLNLSSPKSLLIERRCLKKLLEKFRDSDKKQKIVRYFIFLIRKYGKKLNGSCEHEEEMDVTTKDLFSGINSNEIEANNEQTKPKQFSGLHEHSTAESDRDLYPQDVPPEEYLCPLSSRLMYDPVIIASGQTYERASIEAWFSKGNDTCPKTKVKLSNLVLISNASLNKLISQWCQERGILLQNPSEKFISASADTSNISHSSSMSSVQNISAALLYGKAANYLFQGDLTTVSTVSSDASVCSNLSNRKFSERLKKSSSLKFSWSDDYTKYQSFAQFNYDSYLKFLSDLSKLPPTPHIEALKDVKKLFESGVESCHTMLCNGFSEAIMDFLKDACDSFNARAQETGLQILLALLRKFSFKVPSISNDAVRLLPLLLSSQFTLEALTLVEILTNHRDTKSIIVASDIILLIIDILIKGDSRFVGSIVEILSRLSSSASIKSLILSSNCLSNMVPVLKDEQHAGGCLKILVALCETEEGREEVAITNGCIPNIAEFLDCDDPEEQADATAILLSLCSSRSPRKCSLVLNEGVIPSLVGISVNGNPRGKKDSTQLLGILRERTRNDQTENVIPVILPPNPGNLLVVRHPASSKKPGFIVKVRTLFSKIKS